MTDTPTFVYITYIEATPEQVWYARTNAEVSAVWWAHSNVSDWQTGSRWEHRRADDTRTVDVAGTVVEIAAPTRLVLTWAAPGEERLWGPAVYSSSRVDGPSRVTFDIESCGEIVRLTVTHENLGDERERDAAAWGWAAVLSNLKSLLETGSPLPQEPWLVDETLADRLLRSLQENRGS
jgi:uncharacterized protein YndB with AHSA1/START domain